MKKILISAVLIILAYSPCQAGVSFTNLANNDKAVLARVGDSVRLLKFFAETRDKEIHWLCQKIREDVMEIEDGAIRGALTKSLFPVLADAEKAFPDDMEAVKKAVNQAYTVTYFMHDALGAVVCTMSYPLEVK